MTKIRYLLEAALLHILLFVFSLMPASTASNIGGAIGRFIGPKLAASRKAKRNIELALPALDSEKTVTGMWDNLGRVMAEYPHLETLAGEAEIVGMDILKAGLEHPNGAVFISAHLGNWEMNASSILAQTGKAIELTYRAPNNPYSDKLLYKARSMNGRIPCHPKSAAGGKAMIKALKAGGVLGILIDQKYNEGIEAAFFGRPAMTNSFFVQMAQKFKCPLIPFKCERLDGARFRITVYEGLETFDQKGAPRAIEDVIKDSHTMMEGWIKDRPEQWLWLHRRWKD